MLELIDTYGQDGGVFIMSIINLFLFMLLTSMGKSILVPWIRQDGSLS